VRDIRRPFLALLLGFLGVGVIVPEGPVRAGGGEDPPGAVTTPDQARQDPDLPGFLEGRIDKGEYLRMRHEARARKGRSTPARTRSR
jgi:hypothetical protein